VELWNRILERVRAEVGARPVELWLEGARLDLRGREATLTVSSALARDRVIEKLLAPVARALEAELEASPVLRVVAAEAGGMPKGEPAEGSLESFVVGAGSRLAYEAATRVCDEPGRAFNPLVLFGGEGLGKTHLLHGIARRLLVRPGPTGRREARDVVLATAQGFADAFVPPARGVRVRGEPARGRYRGAFALLLDDLQALRKRPSAQLELLHTLETLHHDGRQVVVACAPHPKRLDGIHEGLRGRLLGGLVAELRPPDYETRRRIVEARGGRLGVRLGREVVDFIARYVTESIRDLVEAVDRLGTELRSGAVLDLARARSALGRADLGAGQGGEPRRRSRLTPEEVIRAVAEELGVEASAIAGGRAASATRARQAAMYVLRRVLGLTFEAIGDIFGRQASTVSFACGRVAGALSGDEALRRAVDGLVARLEPRRPPGPDPHSIADRC